jgi:putative nucleotidyltransferase with HDIG domain
MKEGACDYLLKPLEPDTVVASVHRALELKRLEREMEKSRKALEEAICRQAQQLGRALAFAERTCDEVLQVLGCALNLRDTCTAGHSQRVTRYSIELARAMRCPPAQLREIARGAYLHDLGKIGIPDAILQKPGPLTPEEKAIMETHVRIGYELVSRISFMEAPAGIILAHQEHFDGTGYPRGLAGSEIPIGARIFALADTLDAMTSERPYRKALPFPVARDEIIRESGRQFDPEIVRAFLSIPEQRWENLRHDSSLPDFDCSFTGEADGTGGEKLIVWRRQPS